MRFFLPGVLILPLVAALALRADSVPTSIPSTSPAVDYSSPKALYLSLLQRTLAGHFDAANDSTVPPASEDELNALRYPGALAYRSAIVCALINRFGANIGERYRIEFESIKAEYARAQRAIETINGNTGTLDIPSPDAIPRSPNYRPIEFRKVGGKWLMLLTPRKVEEQQLLINKSMTEFAGRILREIQDGTIHSVAEFEKQQAVQDSKIASLRLIEPIYKAPAFDPAGLRAKVVAVPAAASEDHLFHVDLALQNTGKEALHLYLGVATHDNTIPISMPGIWLEAVDADGKPQIIRMLTGAGGTGPRPTAWVITLHPGDSFSLRPKMAFGAPAPAATQTGRRPPGAATMPLARPFIAPGDYTFTATVMSNQVHEKHLPGDLYPQDLGAKETGLSGMAIWTGTVISEPIKLEVPVSSAP